MNFHEINQESCNQLLRERFGLDSFRKGQVDIISSILNGRDALAVLPTGGGKSLCYQFPAVYKNQLVIVISPLIALMKDQVASLDKIGIPAGCLHSGQDEDAKKDVFQRMSLGGAFILYLSPERAQKEGFHRWIAKRVIALFAIDEAHCVSQWGHDFREEYSQLRSLKSIRPDVPVLALTASATPMVLEDISVNLSLQNPERHVHGFYRNNLYYQVEPCLDETEKLSFLAQAIRQTPEGRILVYCGTRRSVEETAAFLAKKFPAVAYYHAGLSDEDRDETQESYANAETRILVATNAFGMGIDHPNVRLVVHFHMPANIDALYQEMGRAGRDGRDSTCLMLYSKKDKGLQSFFIEKSNAPAKIKKSRRGTLDALVAYAEGGECRHSEILTYYQDSQRIDQCGHCDTCIPASLRKVTKSSAPISSKENSLGRKIKRKKAATNGDQCLDGMEQSRFTALKQWRKQKARELDTAAFIIFSDRTLRHLAQVNPRTTNELEAIHGFGEIKRERFGSEVLAELRLLDKN